MNKCIFLSRTTKEVELRYTANNTAVGKFSIAVDTGYGENKKTSFLNMTAWGKTAESLSKYAPKGTKLLLECQAVQNQYKDKNGNNVNTVDFTVLSFEFAESKAKQTQETQTQENNNLGNGFYNLPESDDEELPFF